MKLGVKITLIVVSLILLVIVLTVCICSGIAGRINDKSVPSEKLSSWMSMIEDDVLLKNVVIPGSHDAGTNGMVWFSKTQSRNIDDQLACGTRYFDLRVKSKKGECRIYHGPAYGVYLKDILREVRDFLIENPSENVILDVHKFGNAEAKTQTVALLDEYLDGLMVENKKNLSDLQFIENLTLGEVRGKCLLIWGDDDEYARADNRYFLRNDDHGNVEVGCLQSFYERNWNWYYSSKKYIDKAIPAYINKYKESIGGLFVLQCQLTDGCLIIGPRYREGCHEKNMNNYIEDLWNSEDLQYINILMRDFISPSKNSQIIALNFAKNIVKQDCEEDFCELVGIKSVVIED